MDPFVADPALSAEPKYASPAPAGDSDAHVDVPEESTWPCLSSTGVPVVVENSCATRLEKLAVVPDPQVIDTVAAPVPVTAPRKHWHVPAVTDAVELVDVDYEPLPAVTDPVNEAPSADQVQLVEVRAVAMAVPVLITSARTKFPIVVVVRFSDGTGDPLLDWMLPTAA